MSSGGKVVGGAVELAGRAAAQSEFQVLSWSKNGEAAGPLVYAHYGVTDPEHQYDDYEHLDVHGKIVVVLRKLPPGKNLPDRLADVREKVANAVRHGASGLVLTNRAQDDDEFMRAHEAADDKGIVVVQAKRSLLEQALSRSLADLEQKGPSALEQSAHLSAQMQREGLAVANVVALLRGSDPQLANEYVVIGAHYDHLGRGFPKAWNPFSCKGAKEGLIFHGADDNASGTAGMLEIAEAFAGEHVRPRRSVVFAAFTAEESGLLGSHHFVDHSPVPIDKVVAMVNLDMIGRLRDGQGVEIEGSATAPEWQGLVDAANLEHIKVTASKSIMEDSDHAPFYRKDRPVIFFFTGMHPQYHCHTDTADLINGEGLARVARLAYRVAREVADAQAAHAGLTFAKVPTAHRGAGGMPGPRLGIAPDYSTQGGLGVAGVIDGGPAAKAGLKVGDLITMLGGKEISSIEDYMAVLSAHKPGDVVELVVKRGQSSITVSATLEGRSRE
jgi:hypothetical protein